MVLFVIVAPVVTIHGCSPAVLVAGLVDAILLPLLLLVLVSFLSLLFVACSVLTLPRAIVFVFQIAVVMVALVMNVSPVVVRVLGLLPRPISCVPMLRLLPVAPCQLSCPLLVPFFSFFFFFFLSLLLYLHLCVQSLLTSGKGSFPY